MHIYEHNGVYVAETEYQSERIVQFGQTWEEAKERLQIRLLVLEMIG